MFGFFKRKEKAINPVNGGGGWRSILEPFSGAWQKNISETVEDVRSYPTLYACINRISSDLAKLPFQVRELKKGIWYNVENAPILKVLEKPNSYQNAPQFRENWGISKLTAGNTYILKQRDARGNVTQLYILDPSKVAPAVSELGEVYYILKHDRLNKLPENYPLDKLIVPASEIIHDRLMPLGHPLLGIPPVAAANWAAVKNLKITRSATEFFSNNAQPSGLITAPAGMSQKDADEVKEYWETEFSGGNSGKVAIIGAEMKFTPFAMKSIDAQMIEQLKHGDEQICQPFGIPPFKVGIGSVPTALGIDGLNQLYYSDALQQHIQAIEALLNEHLLTDKKMAIELNLDPLLRMDEAKRAEVEASLVGAKIKTPDEGRLRFNLEPIAGGDTLWGQSQDVPLGILADARRFNPTDPLEAPTVNEPIEAPKEPEKPKEPEENKALNIDIKKSIMEFTNARATKDN